MICLALNSANASYFSPSAIVMSSNYRMNSPIRCRRIISDYKITQKRLVYKTVMSSLGSFICRLLMICAIFFWYVPHAVLVRRTPHDRRMIILYCSGSTAAAVKCILCVFKRKMVLTCKWMRVARIKKAHWHNLCMSLLLLRASYLFHFFHITSSMAVGVNQHSRPHNSGFWNIILIKCHRTWIFRCSQNWSSGEPTKPRIEAALPRKYV